SGGNCLIFIIISQEGTSEIVEDTEDESLDSDAEREGLDDEGYGLEDEVPGLKKEEEVAPEGQQQAPTLVTWVDPEDCRVYTDISTYVPPVAHVQTPPSSELSSGSLRVSPSSPVVPTLVA
nr:hypothetical protein [Tanacetum cinerariifolium]